MSQLQSNERTSTKRVNPSGSYRPESQKKKTSDISGLTPRLILPKNPLTELQQQNVPQFSSQQHKQRVIQPLQPQQQQNIHPQLQQQDVFSQILPQGLYVQQQYESNPQLYSLPPISPELEEIHDETNLQNSQPEKRSIPGQSFTKKKDNYEQDQDVDEKSGSWESNEIKILLDYLKENFSSWSKGNKTKFYNNIAKSILPNKEVNAIKGKLSRLIKKYEDIKKHNNQSGVDRKDWCWYDQLDEIFGTRENITPSFLANRSTDIIEEEAEANKESQVKKENHKKQKGKNNVEVISMAMVEMNQSREKIWEQKMLWEKEKLEKSHELERERIEAEKEKWAYEKEKEKERWAYEKEKEITERERAKMEFELRMKELELRYQKKN